MEKTIITVAVTGSLTTKKQNSNVPYAPEEIAEPSTPEYGVPVDLLLGIPDQQVGKHCFLVHGKQPTRKSKTFITPQKSRSGK